MISPDASHTVPPGACPVIVPALSVSLFFDALDANQLAGIRAAWGRIHDLLSPHLKWYMTDSLAERQRLTPGVLAHLPSTLEQVATRRPYFAFRAHGGDAAGCLGPWALDLWVDKPRVLSPQERALMSAVFKVSSDQTDRIANCLRVSFPAAGPAGRAEDLEALTLHLMEHIPFLHGNAGFALLFDDALPGFEREHWAALAGIAMRHPGYDVLHYAAVRSHVVDRIKTVNWLTFLGPELMRGIDHKRFADPGTAIVVTAKRSLYIKASAEPAIGDVNRGDRLPEYRWVAQRLAPLLMSHQEEFGAAFDDDLTQKWVARFNED